jgi:FkbM family methyltransferase
MERVERHTGAMAVTTRELLSGLDGLGSRLDSAVARSEQLSLTVYSISAGLTQLDGLIRKDLASRCPSLSLNSTLPEFEPHLVQLAESLAILRPLIPYPEWRFDVEWYNPDLAFQVRQRIWQHFTDRHCLSPVSVPWHFGTRLSLTLTNDLSRQIFIGGCIDPNEFAFLERFLRPGMTFVDIGANEGIYSVFAAPRVGPTGTVWAFEPSGRELARLRRNAERNALDIRIFAAGLSDEDGDAGLIVVEERYGGQNTLGRICYEGVNQERVENVTLFRLDNFVRENPVSRIDVIKIDIEGAELRALRGAIETLHRYRPVMLFEVGRLQLSAQGTSPEELLDFVRAQGYTVYKFDPATGLPITAGKMEYGENMIAVPAEISLPSAVFSYLPAGSLDS